VLGVYPQGEKPIFRVTFNDGTETECCDEHLWLTQTYRDTKTGREGTVKSLAEIRETLRYGKEARYNHAVPLVAPVEFDQCEGEHLGMFRQRLLHPYVMGAYLGDGTSWGTMRFHNPEADVRAKFASLLPETDELVEEGPVTCRVRRKRRNHEPSTALQHLGQYPIFGACAEDKAIPIDYQYAPVADRIALLQGLFDTDGHVYGPGVEFSTSSFWLAHDVALVVRSLGGTVTSSDRVPTFKYKHEVREGQRAYRLFVQFENGIVPVSSAKHLARWTTRQRTQRKWITSVEPVGVKPAQCIKVSAPDSLYVTDDFIVTHNTAFSLDVAYRAADSNVPVYYFSLEMSREQLWRRLLCRAAGVSPTKLVKGELTPEDWAKIRATQADLRGRERFPFFVEDSTRDIRKIMDIAWRLKEEHGHGIVVIDYLGLLSWHKGEKEYDATTRNSKESKLLAKATGMPVLELVQLNRTGDDTSVGAEVSDSMLRSSGQIEQDADVILFMLGERGPGIKEREIVIQKERDREAGHRILMEFNPYLMQFGAQGAWFTLDNHLAITQPVSGADDHTLAWGFEDGEQRAADIERELEPTLAAPRDVRAFGFGEMTETVIEGVRADLLALETLG